MAQDKDELLPMELTPVEVHVSLQEDVAEAKRAWPGVPIVVRNEEQLRRQGELYHRDVIDPHPWEYQFVCKRSNAAVDREYDLLCRVIQAQKEFTETIKPFLPPELQTDTWRSLERDCEGMKARRAKLIKWVKDNLEPQEDEEHCTRFSQE